MLLRKKISCVSFALAAGALLAFVPAVLSAQAESGFIAEGFRGDASELTAGALVSLEEGSEDAVELSRLDNAERLIGVVSQQAFLEVSDADSTVQVVLSGRAPMLVSNLNGDIESGDRVVVSPVAGVGMKAAQSGVSVGVALADLSGADTAERTVTDQDGQLRSIDIGLIPVQIKVSAYTEEEGGPAAGVPSVLQDIADSIAGRSVSPLRIIFATAVSVVLFAAVVIILYSAVRSSIISIGRNPLSESSLRKNLMQIGLMVLGIAAAGLAIVYVILRI